jgi:NADPH-dependent 2,4-dienoyl-CoA reductase/sulfur reductase-like enzyme
MAFTRRNILQMVPAFAALGFMPGSFAAVPHRVVVVGGGFAGATIAKYLKLWARDNIQVTLVEPNPEHISCIMSNLVLNRRLTTGDLAFNYSALQRNYGVKVLQDRAEFIDGPNKILWLAGSGAASYDSLVVATGIQFDAIDGLDPMLVPHAWIAGAQTNLLRDQIEAMPDDGTFVMTVPPTPYRCPPGPYERACLVADILGRRSGVLGRQGSAGRSTPRVVVLDANPGIQAEKETFTRAFNTLYGEIVEYIPDAQVIAVDSANREVETTRGAYLGDVLNVIPRHSAPGLLLDSGLTGGPDVRWAPVEAETYASSLANFPGVYVVGDAQGTSQPKSGHMANSQAKVCADAIIRTASGLSPYTDERLTTLTTNSACFSPITRSKASWLTAVYRYDPASRSMKLVPGSLGEAHRWDSENFEDMFTWSDSLFADTFG